MIRKRNILFFILSMRECHFGTKFDTLLFDSHTVSHSVSICYLGVILDQHLLWKPTLTAYVIIVLEVLLYLRCPVGSCLCYV